MVDIFLCFLVDDAILILLDGLHCLELFGFFRFDLFDFSFLALALFEHVIIVLIVVDELQYVDVHFVEGVLVNGAFDFLHSVSLGRLSGRQDCRTRAHQINVRLGVGKNVDLAFLTAKEEVHR